MFARLKGLRSKLTATAYVPAYIVFSDASLRDRCQKRPTTMAQLLELSGVSKIKAEKYGKQFVGVIGAGG